MTALHRVADPAGLEALLSRVAVHFKLGRVRDHAVIDTGYEDCNVRLHTHTGHFLVKVFGPPRRRLAKRTADIICAAVNAGVAHPRLFRNLAGAVTHHDSSGNSVIVMDYVRGSSFFELGRPPTHQELAAIVAEAARIHPLGLDLPFVHDPWAIPNLPLLADRLENVITDDDRTVVRQAVAAFERVDEAALPRALVHGDLTQGNVLRTAQDEVMLIDFAVANRAPRVQELAVLAVNLMHDDPLDLQARVDLLSALYQQHAPLTPAEMDAFPTYALAAAAMEFLGALNAQLNGADTDETSYLIGLGRQELRAGAASLAGR